MIWKPTQEEEDMLMRDIREEQDREDDYDGV